MTAEVSVLEETMILEIIGAEVSEFIIMLNAKSQSIVIVTKKIGKY